ncbi:unnamed protein product, partial [Chrysoparadoxa australica]
FPSLLSTLTWQCSHSSQEDAMGKLNVCEEIGRNVCPSYGFPCGGQGGGARFREVHKVRKLMVMCLAAQSSTFTIQLGYLVDLTEPGPPHPDHVRGTHSSGQTLQPTS